MSYVVSTAKEGPLYCTSARTRAGAVENLRELQANKRLLLIPTDNPWRVVEVPRATVRRELRLQAERVEALMRRDGHDQ